MSANDDMNAPHFGGRTRGIASLADRILRLRRRAGLHKRIDQLTDATHRIAAELKAQRETLSAIETRLSARDMAEDVLTRETAQIGERLDTLETLTARVNEFAQVAAGNSAGAARFATMLRRRGQPIRVGFLVHNYEAWGALRAVHALMRDDPRFEPVVFTIARRFPGAETFGDEDHNSACLAAEGVGHVRLNDDEPEVDIARMKAFDLEVIFRQSHWQADVPPVFRTEHLTFATQYYVPYAIAPLITSGGGIIGHTRKDLLARQFVACETSRDILRAHDRLDGARLTVSGHPKVTEVQNARPSWPIASGNAKRTIWSAHHAISTGWNNFGVFPQVCDEMLALATRRPDIDFLFSPHPGLLSRINATTGDERARYEAFFAAWDALGNTGQLRTGEYQGPFAASDILIVDGLSFLMEYQLLKKPVIRLSRPDHSPWNALGERVARGTHELPATRIEDIEALIEGLLDGSVPRKDDVQQALIDELTPRGDPARFIVETIHEDLRAGVRPTSSAP